MIPLSSKHDASRPSSPETWGAMGGDHIWLPYAQMKTVREPLIAVSTEGCRITLQDGRVLVDGVASWWTACHGYNHPSILKAMRDQLNRMPHVMFGGINHEPALRLAARLSSCTPGDLDRVLFVDSGSVAIEAALKMAIQFWANQGHVRRTKFVHFRHGYHGDTSGCMAICDPDLGMYGSFPSEQASRQFIVDLPHDASTTDAFQRLLQTYKDQIAAVVIEPLVQGVGGMKFHDTATLRRVRDITSNENILLIADEVFTGFGRTGTLFASEQAGIVPDMLCLGKALSACTVTLAAVIARRSVFDAFWSDDPQKAFMHGPTYMANPIACAAANASLDLFEQEPRLDQAKALESALLEGLGRCAHFDHVIDVRSKGAIGVVQMESEFDHARARQQFIDRGVWVRSWGDHIYLTPALNIEASDLERLMTAVYEVAENVF